MVDPLWIPDRRDMIWIDFNPQAGDKEMKDHHPMMVLSSKVFSERTGLVIGLPMTSAPSNAKNTMAISFVHKSETKYILAYLPKSFDFRKRKASPHPWGKVPQEAFDEARGILEQIITLST